MKLMKFRLFNKFRIGLIGLSLFGMFFFWIFDSGFFNATIGLKNGVDMTPDRVASTQKHLLESILTLNGYMDTNGYAPTIMLVLLFSSVILFYREKNGLFCFRYARGESQKKVILSTIFSHAFINAVLYYLIYVIYLSVGYLFIGNRMSYVSRNIFDGIFGEGFSHQSPYLYYLVQGIPSFFIGTFVYTVMVCAAALFCRKAYQAVICMLSYYWGLQIVLEFLRKTFMGPRLAWIVGTFEPTHLYGFYGYVYHNPSIGTVLQAMSSLLVPALVSTVLLVITFRKEEKLYE